MVERFVDRYNELKLLREKFQKLSSGGELVVIYGRRRLGKTTLIRRFLKKLDCKPIYFFVTLSEKKGLMAQFAKNINEATGKTVKIDSWHTFFQWLKEETDRHPPVVIAIDEFQRFDEISTEFVSLLQHYWDDELKNKKIMIILSGSSIGMMTKLALNSTAPLFGRVTTKIKLKPFRYIDFRVMFNDFDEVEKMEFYTVFGGTPHYLDLVRKERVDLPNTIVNLMLKDGSPLMDEPQTLLSTELDSHTRYNSILYSLSKGKIELKEIQDFLGLTDSGKIMPYLNTLEKLLDLIKKNRPVFGKKRQTRYMICDNFFKFWYKFIFSNAALLEMKNYRVIINKIKTRIENQIGFTFEDVIKELLKLYNGSKINDFSIDFEEIGSWWEKTKEIDIVMVGRKDIVLGDVKWSNKLANMQLLDDLKEKSKYVNYQGRIRYMLVSKSGFTEDLKRIMEKENILYLDLNDVGRLFDEKTKQEKVTQQSLMSFFGV